MNSQTIHNLLLVSPDPQLVARLCKVLAGPSFLGAVLRVRAHVVPGPLLDHCDIALIDEALGAIGSWDLARTVRAAAGDRPVAVIGLVSRVDLESMGRARALGLDGFIRKSSLDSRLATGLGLLSRRVPARSATQETTYVELDTLPQQVSGVLPLDEEDEGPGETRRQRESSPDLSGVLLGKVRLEQKIGSGAGGAVYRGTHLNLVVPVAVKVLHAELVHHEPEYAMAFLREARTAARVTSANVVRMLDCDRDDEGTGAYYLVMEYVEGGSLEDLIRRHGRVTENRLVGIAIGTAHALVAAERAGIVHRDVKPGNILLQEDDRVKLSDLGLAQRAQPLAGLARTRALGSPSRRPGRAGAGEEEYIQGTPLYMAPEQITEPGAEDLRADIYSLGATLYHAAVGQPPFPGDEVSAILLHHLRSALVPPRGRCEEISEGFSRIITKMLQKDPEHRPSSHREVLSMLRAHMQEQVTSRQREREGKGLRIARRLLGE